MIARLVLITGQLPSALENEDAPMLMRILEMYKGDMEAIRGDDKDEEFEAWKRANGFA